MPNLADVPAPLTGTVLEIHVRSGQVVAAGQLLVLLESMKVHVRVEADCAGTIDSLYVDVGSTVQRGAPLIGFSHLESSAEPQQQAKAITMQPHASIAALDERQALSLDTARSAAAAKRHAKGYCTARENLAALCDDLSSFQEYGQLAVAAQRNRIDYDTLKTSTAADGIITGVGPVNGHATALIINDYSVLAGTQGYFHHQKLDRMLHVAAKQGLPVIMYTEGGGGRPGDTDITTVNSGLHCASFGTWAGLSGQVPRISVANGYNFAGNAALFGAADITIATEQSWIGMAGPAMIEGGGLGRFMPKDIGPTSVQQANGVVDIVARDEVHAAKIAKQVLGYFQSSPQDWQANEQTSLASVMPTNRRQTYAVRQVIETLADVDSWCELKAGYGGAIVVGLARIEGRAIGIMANDCTVLGGAIDVAAGEKAAGFMQLCDQFSIPLLSLCDTPGFMVGPEHETLGAVRRLAELFRVGAQLNVPLWAVVLRKCYGLGAQAMLGGSTQCPSYTLAWPTGEFGPMGLEGAVKLGYSKQLAAESDPEKREALFQSLLEQQYQRGQAVEVASVLEIDAVINPVATRQNIALQMASLDS